MPKHGHAYAHASLARAYMAAHPLDFPNMIAMIEVAGPAGFGRMQHQIEGWKSGGRVAGAFTQAAS